MKSALAKARDEWLNNEEGKRCCEGTPTGQYLQNRLERAFLAGANFPSERIKKLEKALRQARQYYRKNKPIAMFSVIEQALKG